MSSVDGVASPPPNPNPSPARRVAQAELTDRQTAGAAEGVAARAESRLAMLPKTRSAVIVKAEEQTLAAATAAAAQADGNLSSAQLSGGGVDIVA